MTTFEGTIAIFLFPLLALVFLIILNRFWAASERQADNDVTGMEVNVLGTIYAVIIGFMLFAVWNSYLAADLNAEAEANCLISIFHLADGLPSAQRDEVKRLARQYADVVIEREWPAMHTGELSVVTEDVIEQLWNAASQARVSNLSEQVSMNQILTEISVMSEHRRIRQHDSEYSLPPILWMVLIVGGIITILSACLFGIENVRLHFIHVGMLSLLIVLILVATTDIDHPFQGPIYLHPHGFERARVIFAQSH